MINGTGVRTALADSILAPSDLKKDPRTWLRWAQQENERGRKLSAILVLLNGLEHTNSAPELTQAIEFMGIRRDPILRFLSRNHPFNRALGRLRHRLLGPVRLSA
jgi:hypothetical protein